MKRCRVFALVISLGFVILSEADAFDLIDRYEEVKEGQWVKTKWSNGTVHTLLIAKRQGDIVTLEEKIEDRGFITAWTQTDIDINNRKVLAHRYRDPLTQGVIEEKASEDEELDLVLRLTFDEEGDEKLKLELEFYDEEKQKTETRKVSFECKKYKTIWEGKFVEIWFSDEIPLYPLKVNIFRYDLTIKLVGYGENRNSDFYPAKQPEENNQEKCSSND